MIDSTIGIQRWRVFDTNDGNIAMTAEKALQQERWRLWRVFDTGDQSGSGGDGAVPTMGACLTPTGQKGINPKERYSGSGGDDGACLTPIKLEAQLGVRGYQ